MVARSFQKCSYQNISAAVMGNILEWYDFTLFGTLATIFARLFFPQDELYSVMLKSYGVFAAGFIMRPLGALILGYIGDKKGRKPALLLSLFFMALSTFCLGLLPTYQQIGIYAPILLIILRLCQSFAMGGEYGSSMVYLAEHAPSQKRAFYSSWVDCGCLIGVLLGTLSAWLLNTYLSTEAYLNWGWRLPFLASFILALVTYYFRKKFAETPQLEQPMLKKQTLGTNFKLTNFIPAICVYAFGNVCFYLFITFLPNYLLTTQGIFQSHSFLLTTLLSAFIAILIPFAGYLSDQFGRRIILSIGIIGATVWIYPLLLSAVYNSFIPHFICQLMFALFLALFYGGEAAYLAELFPSTFRCTSVSLTLSLTNIIFGGCTPLFATWLTQQFGNITTVSCIVMLLALLALISLGSSAYSKEKFFGNK